MPDDVPAAGAGSTRWGEWIGVIKLLIGSVAATAITTIASCHLKHLEVTQADRGLEREFLNKHFEYFTDPKNKDSRLLLAQYCATVFGGRWTEYKEELQAENKKLLEDAAKEKADLLTKKKEAQEVAAKTDEPSATETKQAAIDLKLVNVQEQINQAQTARNIAGLAPVTEVATNGATEPAPRRRCSINRLVLRRQVHAGGRLG